MWGSHILLCPHAQGNCHKDSHWRGQGNRAMPDISQAQCLQC